MQTTRAPPAIPAVALTIQATQALGFNHRLSYSTAATATTQIMIMHNEF